MTETQESQLTLYMMRYWNPTRLALMLIASDLIANSVTFQMQSIGHAVMSIATKESA